MVHARQGHYENEKHLAEYVHCVFKGVHFQDDHGHVSCDKIKARIPGHVDKVKAEKLIEECCHKTGDSPAHTAMAVFKCYVEKKQFELL